MQEQLAEKGKDNKRNNRKYLKIIPREANASQRRQKTLFCRNGSPVVIGNVPVARLPSWPASLAGVS